MLVIVPGMCDHVCVMQQGPQLHCMATASPGHYHNLAEKEGAIGLQYHH